VRTIARTQKSRSEATQAALLAAARIHFGKAGFHAVSLEELAAAAGVTRGALYHHFDGKVGLFLAVARQVIGEIVTASRAIERTGGQPWGRVIEGFEAYLRYVASNAQAQRIVLIDAPAVLGFAGWHDLLSDTLLPGLVSHLQAMRSSGKLNAREPEALAHLILAAMNEAALIIAHADNREDDTRRIIEAFVDLLSGLAPSPE